MRMRIASVWREWESGDSLPLSLLRIAVLFCGMLFLGFTAVLGLPWPQQALVAVLTVAVAVWLDRGSSSYVVTLTLILLSVYSTFRYGFWRVTTTMAVVRGAGSRWAVIDAGFMLLLLAAEIYAFVVLLMGYMQMVWPLRRTPVPLPDSTADWPAVDVLIPTYNEPLDVVRFTVLAALNIDWPADKLRVYLLDDGRREEFREFARQAGAGYLTREDNLHAKAGNLNAALERTESPFVVVFDADHVPTRSFLQVTMGWFLRDAQLGILQTPHHFYSPDPFERNLGQFRSIPNEDELFYGVVQDGNDFWNATYFCGSCAVLRRSALDEAGGMATDTVTEDAHTSMRMQRLGWNSAYINIPQAAGLATETLSAHVRQRIRWARGMVQILRIENPMFGPGLTLAQRLCYLNAMSHFLYAIPRLIFLTAPLMYLIFGYTNIPGYWGAILAYAAPHLVLSRMTRSRIQGRHRHSFWTEIFETVLAPYLVLPTLGALLQPRRGRFNVTPKGETVEADYFDAQVARPTLILLACNWFGLCCSAPRLIQFPSWRVPAWGSFVNWPAALYDPGHVGTVIVNAGWTLFNLVLLGVALAVAWESQQRRRSVRVETKVPSEVLLQDGSIVRGVTADLSSGGVRTTMEYDVSAAPGDRVQFVFAVLDGTATLPGTVVSMKERTLRARFDDLTLEQYEALTMILYARADRWLGWGEAREPDRPVQSFVRVLRLAARGLRQAFFGPGWREEETARRTWPAGVVPLVVFALTIGLGERSAAGAQSKGRAVDPLVALARAKPETRRVTKSSQTSAEFHRSFTLAQAGVRETITLRGAESKKTVPFTLPQGALVNSAVLKLRYRFSRRLLPGVSSLKVSLNGNAVATIPVVETPEHETLSGQVSARQRPTPGSRLEAIPAGEQSEVQESDIVLPAELLGRSNELTFEFTGHITRTCEDPTDSGLWSHVDTASALDLAGSTIPLQDDLGLLPMPFFQPGLSGDQTVQIAFLQQPSRDGIRAAGIIASWFGVSANARPVRFAVSIGRIPSGNVVVFAEGRSGLPAALNLTGQGAGAFALVHDNPVDGSGKILVLMGSDGPGLARAALAVASEREPLQGAQAELPAKARERVSTAPRWLSTDTIRTFANVDTVDFDGDGTQTASAYVRLPPDLYFGKKALSVDSSGDVGTPERTVPLHVLYRYNGVSAGAGSELQVWVNGAFVRSIPLPHGGRNAMSDEAVVPVPAVMLRPFSNTISFRWAFAPVRGAGCAVAAGGDFHGTISKDSYLDLQGIPHWTELPNLELFANAGYPFTREADLGHTTVIVPDQPTAEELELYLGMMGHFGAQTGTASTGVKVAGADAVHQASGNDLLVLGTATDQPVLRDATVTLPFLVDDTGAHLRQSGGLVGTEHAWWKVRGRDAGIRETVPGPGMPDAFMESIEWPASSRRTMVVIAARDDAAASGFTSAFLSNSQSSAIAHAAAVLSGGTFTSYPTSGRLFMAGHLPLLERAGLSVAQFPWAIAVLSVIFCFLMASLLRTALRRSARVRLQGNY
jgi:cellulose synthase (UDP-forming)